MKKILCYILPITLYLGSCGEPDKLMLSADNATSSEKATIVSVAASGVENNYTFSVGVSSKETGCKQYADWWEVISEDGNLIYRKILEHSHVNQQPFVRSGGAVAIVEDQIVIVRAHMNTSGYGTVAFKGSVAEGFVNTDLAEDFANELASQAPLPDGCNF